MKRTNPGPSRRSPRLSRRHWMLTALAPLVLTACRTGAASDLKRTSAGKSRGFAGFHRVIVRDFQDRVTEGYNRSALDRRAKKQAEMKGAVTRVPDLLAEALRRTQAFPEVARSGLEDDNTLVIDGALVRYDEGDGTARLYTRNQAGNAQLELRLELRDGATGAVLATLIGENGPAGVGRGPQTSESLSGALGRVVDRSAATIAREARR